MPAYEKYAKNISEGLSMLHGFGANDNYGEQIFNDNEIRIIGEELTSIKESEIKSKTISSLFDIDDGIEGFRNC